MAPVFTLAPAPVLGQKEAALLSGRWRQQLRRLIENHQLDPTAVLESGTHPLAGEEHSSESCEVDPCLRSYSPVELPALLVAHAVS